MEMHKDGPLKVPEDATQERNAAQSSPTSPADDGTQVLLVDLVQEAQDRESAWNSKWSLDNSALEDGISKSKVTPKGLVELVQWILRERRTPVRCAALSGLQQILKSSSRGQFSSGESSFVFPDAYLSCSMDSADGLSVPPLKLGSLRGYTFSTWIWLEEASEAEDKHHQRVLYRFLTTHGFGSWAMIDLEASEIEVRTRPQGELSWQRARFKMPPAVLQPRQWIHLTVAHSQPYLASPILSLFVDGILRSERQLAYPKLDDHATENIIGQGLGGRFAQPMLFEGAVSQQQALELFAGYSRTRVALPSFLTVKQGGRKNGKGNAQDPGNTPSSNEAQLRKHFSLAKAGHLTPEGISELRTNLRTMVKLGPRNLGDSSSNLMKQTNESSNISSQHWRSSGNETAEDSSMRHEFQQRLKLDKNHTYEDLPVVFYYDARTCIGGDLEEVQSSKNHWRAIRAGGVLETIRVSGKRTHAADGLTFIEPQSLNYSKNLDGVSFGMPNRGMQVYARCVGKTTVVFDLDTHCSLECLGGVFMLLVALVSLVPPDAKIQTQFVEMDGTAPPKTGDHVVLLKLVQVLDEALYAREFYRQDFSHFKGFSLLGWVLRQVPRAWITEDLAQALWDFILRIGSVDISLRLEGLLYVLFDYQVWGAAPENVQQFWVKRMLQYAERFPAEARVAIGVQTILDLLALAEVTSLEEDDDYDEEIIAGDQATDNKLEEPSELLLPGYGDDDLNSHESTDVERNEQNDVENKEDPPSPQAQGPLTWVAQACVDDLVKILRVLISAPSVDSADVSSPSASAKTLTSLSGEDDWEGTGLVHEPGPTQVELNAFFNFVSRFPRAYATTLLLELLAYLLLPLFVITRSWSRYEIAIGRAVYESVQACGGVDFVLALGSRVQETVFPVISATNQQQRGQNRSLMGRLTKRRPENQATIKPIDDNEAKPPPAPLDRQNSMTSQSERTSVSTLEQPAPAKNGLLCSEHGIPPRTRAAMLLLAGRMIQLEEQIDLSAMLREQSSMRGGGMGSEIAEVNKLRRQKQFGIVLRSIMPIPHVASFHLDESEVYKVSREAHANVLDAIVAVIMGSAVQREGVDDFVPHDDSMKLAVPDALPVLGGLLAALSKADEDTKAIAAREILLKLSLILKASYAAREQVTSLPRWQTWLIPVMLLDEKSLNHEDDNSADYLLAEVSTDLLCTLMEHETQRPDDSKAEASKLNRVQYGWGAWQGLADCAMRILKEKERCIIKPDLEEAKKNADSLSLVPEYNSVAEIRATQKTSRVLRQTLERVWERLVVRLQAGGLHEDAVRNFTYTIAMSEEVLLTGLNLLRLAPLSPGGVIASSSATSFTCQRPSLTNSSSNNNSAPPLVCSARCVIDGRHDTKWVDVAREEGVEPDPNEPRAASQSWIQYKYPSFSFQEANVRIARNRHRVVFYSVRSAFDMDDLDPSGWTLFGRNMTLAAGEQGGWTVLDRRSEVRFANRYQQINCWIQNTGFFEEYRIVFDPPKNRGKLVQQSDGSKVYVKLHIGEVTLYECDVDDWHADFGSSSQKSETEVIDAHLQEQRLVASAVEENNGELLRFVRLALQTIKFIRSGSTHGSSPRMNPRQYHQYYDSEAKAQVHDMPKRAMIRTLGHFLRNSVFLPIELVEETISLARSFLAEDLAADSQGNRTLVLVLIHCIHHGLCHLQSVRNSSIEGIGSSEDASNKMDALFAMLASSLTAQSGQLLDEGPRSSRVEFPDDIDSFLRSWSEVWAPSVYRALQRELAAEALHRHTSFRVERSSSTAMARRANPVEVAAYGAGRAQRPVGLPRSTRKKLHMMEKGEDERIYTNQIARSTLGTVTEHLWRKLVERYEIYQIVGHGLDTLPRHRLFRASPFIEPTLRVRTRLLYYPGGNPHHGAASGVKDRMERQKAKEAQSLRNSGASDAEYVEVADLLGVEDTDPFDTVGTREDTGALEDLTPNQGQHGLFKSASGDSGAEEASAYKSWENFGAQLSQHINITDKSLMTRKDEDEMDEDLENSEPGALSEEKASSQSRKSSRASTPASSKDPSSVDQEAKQTKDRLQTLVEEGEDEPLKLGAGVFDNHEEDSEQPEGIILGQRSTVKKTRRPPSVVTSAAEKCGTKTHEAEENNLERDEQDDVIHQTLSSSGLDPISGVASMTPNTPGTPAGPEQRRKLTIEEWVNRIPNPIRGESKDPWPPQHEQVFGASRCSWIRPEFEVPGRLLVTQDAIYFDPDPPRASELFIKRSPDAEEEDPHSAQDEQLELASIERLREELPSEMFEEQMAAWRRFQLRKHKQRRRRVWRLRDLDCILMRRFKMRDSAIEMFVQGQANESFFFNFAPRIVCTLYENEAGERDVRERVVHDGSKVRQNVFHQLWNALPVEVRKRSQRPGESTRRLVARYTERWQRREISNFEYLIRLNIFAGRSVNDLTQYPVFPWVLQDYESEELDLQNIAVYRDLTKPMGALTEDRLMEARERYHTFDDPNTPKFHYGSHYSTMAGVVLYFLVRMEPFTSLHITMQDGHFDIPDRLFGSIPATWRMCTTAMSEVKELTPEFYSVPEFLINHSHFNLGTLHDGSKVGDVELPPWAKGDPYRFVMQMRQALESEYVSRNLHHWIDLIFGHKARLPDAIEADNVFYYLTYPGAVDLDSIDDPAMRIATELQVKHFGQCPEQIFTRSHPPRGEVLRPPFPLGVILAGTFETDRFNRDGMNTCCANSESGPVRSVRLLNGRAMILHESGDLCGFVWGRSDLVHRRDSESTDVEDEEGSDLDAPLEPRRRNTSTGNLNPPLILMPAPEAFETQNEAEKELFCPPIHHLAVSSVRRQLRWTQEDPSGDLSRNIVMSCRYDGRVIAHAGQGIGSIEVYFIDADSGYFRAWSATLFAHMDDVTAVELSFSAMATAAADGSLRVWELRESSGPVNMETWGVASAPRLTLAGHAAPVQALAISETQQVIVSASETNCLVHSLHNGRLLGNCAQAAKERVTIVRVSDVSARILAFAQKSSTLYLYSISRLVSPLCAVKTDGILRDMVLTKQNLGIRAAELILSVGEGDVVIARSCDDQLRTKAVFDVWPEDEVSSPLRSLALDGSEEALIVGASNGTVGLLPMPNFISSGPDVKIPVVGTMDVNAKIQQAKNAVLTKIDKTRVLATARGVASEAAGVATKLGKGLWSVFGGGNKDGK